MLQIKKYGNRRLYDTEESRYITLDQLAEKVQGGADVHVSDAKSGADLTQDTLVQIIMESRGAAQLLPVPLLVQLIRLNRDALGEFLGRYLAGALELYLRARNGAQALAPYNPFATMPFSATDTLAQLFGGAMPGWGRAPPAPAPPPPSPDRSEEQMAVMRQELEALKMFVRSNKPKRAKRR